jgi:hypothetical protein
MASTEIVFTCGNQVISLISATSLTVLMSILICCLCCKSGAVGQVCLSVMLKCTISTGCISGLYFFLNAMAGVAQTCYDNTTTNPSVI